MPTPSEEPRSVSGQVGWLEDTDLAVSVLVVAHPSSGDAIEVMRAHFFDDQDRALGQDTYCLSRGGVSHYGGVLAHALVGSELTLTLTAEAAETLELPSRVTIDVGSDGAALVSIRLATLIGE